jgi:hypothetical protein
VAAATQVMFSAAAWEVLRDYWDMDGAEAARTMQRAISAMFDGLRKQPRRAWSRRRAR